MKKRGKGIAAMFYPIGFTSYANPGSAFLKVNQDGTANLWIGTADIGQGSTTVMAQIAAEELGIEYDKVTVVAADTKLTPFDLGTVASRVTYIVGNAVKIAAAQAKQILFEVAAEDLAVSPDGLASSHGFIYVDGFPREGSPSAPLPKRLVWARDVRRWASGSFNPVTTMLDKETGHGKPYGAYVFGAQVAEVEVDTETGEVEILKITAVHDCGKAINPLFVEGQVEGGVAMGVGFGMMEEMVVERGPGAESAVYRLHRSHRFGRARDRHQHRASGRSRQAHSEPRELASHRCCRPRRPSSMPSRMRSVCASGTCRQRRKKFSGIAGERSAGVPYPSVEPGGWGCSSPVRQASLEPRHERRCPTFARSWLTWGSFFGCNKPSSCLVGGQWTPRIFG